MSEILRLLSMSLPLHTMKIHPVAELRRRPEGAMAPLRKETTINKAPKSLKLPENDLEQLHQKVQKLLGPRPLRKTA